MENPFRALRLSEDLSQYELARRANVSKHAVLRLEQGMYPQPLPTLLSYFENNFPVPRLKLLQDYEEFQVHIRSLHPKILGSLEDLTLMGWSPPVGHPLTFLRGKAGLNPTSLAKALCISQTVVSFFEKRPATQHTVPEQLLNALKDNGYSDEELNVLVTAYKDYRDHIVQRQRELTNV